MSAPIPITVAYGDGIGPEIMRATLRVLDAAGAPLRCERVEIGEAEYRRGHPSGIPPAAWEVLRRNAVLLKGPITTPQGGGYKSLNVTLRTALRLFANVRPCKALGPFVATAHPAMNIVIIRENEEDLYAGIEHQQSQEVVQALKLVSRPGCEAIVRYAFEYARAYGRRKVTCMTKDNIMKLSDGLFHRVFDAVAPEYPDVKAEHRIIDIGAALVAARPETLDVVVTLNLYGDIISDVAAEVAGSVGLAGSANVGATHAMFEAIHGSAPDIAGLGIANPSGLLSAATMMLVHLGEAEVAARIRNAWLCAIEDGVHTPDVYREGLSQVRASTEGFADAVIERLGRTPEHLAPVHYAGRGIKVAVPAVRPRRKDLVGVDVFVDWAGPPRDPDVFGRRIEAAATAALPLRLVTNRGANVYPEGLPGTACSDHWRCRFVSRKGPVGHAAVLELLGRLHAAGFDFVKTEHLCTFDGERGYSLAQGESEPAAAGGSGSP